MPLSLAKLWIIATPIGNTGDFSPRALALLASVDLVLAEDTRRASRLFRESGVVVKRLVSFFEHNEEERQAQAMQALAEGQSVALITDAGTPLLSDPGFRLVRACREAGIAVSPVPGPCAPIAALSAAGIAPAPFTFLGFLPRGIKARKDLFACFGSTPATLVFFERKDRLAESLTLALEILGKRQCAICRELTKQHEEFRLGTLDKTSAICENLLGELTIIIGPPEQAMRTDAREIMALLAEAARQGLRPKEAAKKVKTQVQGYSVSELYALLARQQ